MQSLVNFLKSPAPYTEGNLRDVGEVSGHYFESLRSLIKDVGTFLDSVNAVENIFEIPLIQKEVSVSFQLSLKSFDCFCTWSEKDKLYYLNVYSDLFRR
jgi:hypothetical protein